MMDGSPKEPAEVGEVAIATVLSLCPEGAACVRFLWSGQLRETMARSAVSLSPSDAGCEVAMLFEGGNPDRPFVIGRVRRPAPAPLAIPFVASLPEVLMDGERVEMTAASEIVLRCGKASLTLTRTGKIVLRGTYILSRSSGPNRIKGGSVQLN